MPVTTPVALFTDAFTGWLLLQVPPDVVQASVVVLPLQTLVVPVIGAGVVFTVTTLVLVQVLVAVNVMMAVPAEMPVTTPDQVPTVATLGSLLSHEIPVSQVSTAV